MPWYRDGAMMALAFRATGNLDCIRERVLGLRESYDPDNTDEPEEDDLGQALFLVSLGPEPDHPLVAKALREVPKFEQRGTARSPSGGVRIFAEHPVCQPKWLKFGLRAPVSRDQRPLFHGRHRSGREHRVLPQSRRVRARDGRLEAVRRTEEGYRITNLAGSERKQVDGRTLITRQGSHERISGMWVKLSPD